MTIVLDPSRLPRRANPARIKALHEAGLGVAAIASRVSLSERQVLRWLDRIFGDSWKTPRRLVSEEQRAGIEEMSKEGPPADWVAESAGVSRWTVDKIRQDAMIPIDPEWKRTRLQIQHDPELFRLHLEFAPPRLRRS